MSNVLVRGTVESPPTRECSRPRSALSEVSDAFASAAHAPYTRLCAAEKRRRHSPARSTCADAFGVRSSPLGADMVGKPCIGSRRRGLAEEGRREKVGNDGGTDGGAGGQQPRAATAAGGRLFFSPAF